MCGIFGWIDPSLEVAQADVLIQALRHRGPDDAGWVGLTQEGSQWLSHRHNPAKETKCTAVIGQTRLSIIDLSCKGHQPMESHDGRLQIAFNGEVYNYEELRQELIKLGYRFISDSDTEVVLQALAHWGEQAITRFVGMFSIALLDKHRQCLTLIRDPFGIKPLFYCHRGNQFYFASELPALLKFENISHQLNWQQVTDYIFQGCYEQGAQSFLQEVNYLPPAHLLKVNLSDIDQLSIMQYWQPDPNRTISVSKEEAVLQLQSHLEQSIHLHLRSDVPVGCALSGGLDSSIITCLVKKLFPESQLHTFSFIAEGSAASEKYWVDEVVKHTGVIGHNIIIKPDEILHDMDDFILSQGEPHGGYSIYAQYRIFKCAKEHGITVMLEGQGADESWAGYWGYPEFRLQSLFKQGKFHQIIPFLRAVNTYPGRSSIGIIQRLLQQYISHLSNALWLWGRNLTSNRVKYDWIDQGFVQQHNLAFAWLYPMLFTGKNQLKNRLATELVAQKMVALLRHSDRAAMRFSVESRVPFLTIPMVEFALSLPEHFLVSPKSEPKYILQQATKSLLPPAITERKDKNGFHIPRQWNQALSSWFFEQNQSIEDLPMIDKKRFLSNYAGIPDNIKLRCATFIRWKNLLLS